MKVNKRTELVVGVVSLIAIIILALGFVLVKGIGYSNSIEIKLRFQNSGGIKPSSPVVVNGVKRGTVKEIISDNNSVLIIANLDNIDDIKYDATAKISILEITGGKKIEISTGISSDKFDAKNEIIGSTSKDIGELVGLVGDVSGDIISLVRKLDSISTSLNDLLSDTLMINNLKATVQNTNDLTQDLKLFMNENKNELTNTITNLNTLSKELKVAVQKNEPKVSNLIDSIQTTVTKANKLISNLDITSSEANKLINDVNTIVKEIKNNKSVINKVLYDKQFADDLDSAINNISKLVEFINQNGINVNVRLGTRP